MTIQKFPQSYLALLLDETEKVPIDRDGYYFIDRSGDVFQYILEYMRTGHLLEPEDDFLKDVLYDDMKFFDIQLPEKKRRHRRSSHTAIAKPPTKPQGYPTQQQAPQGAANLQWDAESTPADVSISEYSPLTFSKSGTKAVWSCMFLNKRYDGHVTTW